jgi:hypothetical protein
MGGEHRLAARGEAERVTPRSPEVVRISSAIAEVAPTTSTFMRASPSPSRPVTRRQKLDEKRGSMKRANSLHCG